MTELEGLIARSEAYDQQKEDFGPGQTNQHVFGFGSGGVRIGTPHTLDGEASADWRVYMPMSEWALKQVCQKLGAVVWPGSARSIPYDYLTAFNPGRQAEQLNYWTEKAPDERTWFIRSIQQGDSRMCRAVLTDRYSTVDVTETLRWTNQIVQEKMGNIKLFNPILTPDVLHLKVVVGNVQPKQGGPYGIGVYVSTGEIGNRRIEVAPFIMRTACTNSIWWREEGAYQHAHTGESHVLRAEFLVHMVRALEGGEQLLEAMLQAETMKLPKFTDILDEMCERHGWGIGVRDNILEGTERQETVSGMVNGITWAAQKVEGEAGIDMEGVAGEFLWNMTRGARMPISSTARA